MAVWKYSEKQKKICDHIALIVLCIRLFRLPLRFCFLHGFFEKGIIFLDSGRSFIVLIADKFNPYVDGYSIGSNDLTMTILGCDRDSDAVASLFDERDLAVKRAIRLLIKLAHRDGKTVSICGQAPSVYPEFTEFLVRSGIDSISVNPDVAVSTRKLVARIEQRIILDKTTGKGLSEASDLDFPND